MTTTLPRIRVLIVPSDPPQYHRAMQPRALAAITPIDTSSCFSNPMSPLSPSGRLRHTPTLQTSLPPTEVVPRVYLADLATAENPSVLLHLGITHIVSAMRGTVSLPPTPIPLARLQIPLSDSPFAELAEHLPRVTAFITDALQDPRARVLVHCVQGISRSASVVCAFLIKTYGWTPAQAVQYVKSKRPAAEPNSGFVTQLGEYAESLRAGAAAGGRRR